MIPTTEDLRAAIGTTWNDETIVECVAEAAEVGRVSVAAIMDTTRRGKLAVTRARQGAMWLAHSKGVDNGTLMRFFDMDPSTISHGITAAQKRHDEWLTSQRANVTRFTA